MGGCNRLALQQKGFELRDDACIELHIKEVAKKEFASI